MDTFDQNLNISGYVWSIFKDFDFLKIYTDVRNSFQSSFNPDNRNGMRSFHSYMDEHSIPKEIKWTIHSSRSEREPFHSMIHIRIIYYTLTGGIQYHKTQNKIPTAEKCLILKG